MSELYAVESVRRVLSAKVSVFLGKVLKDYQNLCTDQKRALELMSSIWDVVGGCVDEETVVIYDLVWKEINK